VNRTTIWFDNIILISGIGSLSYLRGFIKRQRVSVYPVERVYLAEILG